MVFPVDKHSAHYGRIRPSYFMEDSMKRITILM